jgi:hypothetical protein
MEKSITKITKLEIQDWYNNNVTKAFADILAEKQMELMIKLANTNGMNDNDANRVFILNAQRGAIEGIYNAIKNKEVFA